MIKFRVYFNNVSYFLNMRHLEPFALFHMSSGIFFDYFVIFVNLLISKCDSPTKNQDKSMCKKWTYERVPKHNILLRDTLPKDVQAEIILLTAYIADIRFRLHDNPSLASNQRSQSLTIITYHAINFKTHACSFEWTKT